MNKKRLCSEEEVKKGPWSSEEDQILINYIHVFGQGKWPTLPQRAGLNRSGKSCRLRWLNYLRPGIIRGNITKNEQDTIIKLQALIGNRWSLIAEMLPGRTDNEIKNYWNTHLSKSKSCKRLSSSRRHKRSAQTRKTKQAKHNQGLPEDDPHRSETSALEYPIIDQNEGSYSHLMAINNAAPTWNEFINNMNVGLNVPSSSTTIHITDAQNGPSEWLMAPDHHCGHTNAKSTVGSTLEQEEEDDLLRFLMDVDLEDFSGIFEHDESLALNPNANDEFPRVIEEDQPTLNLDVADYNPPEIVPSVPHGEPLLMDTCGNLDNGVEIGDKVAEECEPNMESDDLMLDLKKLASFLGVEYDAWNE